MVIELSIFTALRKNPVDRLKPGDLREEELKLKSRINRLRKEIDRIERDKKLKFQEGVGSDLIRKKMLIQELKQLDMEAKLKVKNFMALHRQFMFVSNLLIIKKYERDLRKTEVWKKIQNISPDDFEGALIRVNLSGKGFEGIIDDLNQIFFMDVAESGADLDETEKQLIEAWSSVETGSVNIEDAECLLSIEKNLEKSLEEDN
ncbi:hypothetical protein [Methanoplanus limicola]|jgi:hypothetical protein|uniref:Chromosome assembly protein n=1 Tax=Methanoplanus limicola DSM 2279 TaxID=937775 RepID=H1YX83_9EURY|nr:hypothetical protein [Methanoplanus limicola]EHQ35886.1 hypothetical protein Metlim_1785 [Methanoplanus limicola DSM 2279]